MNLSEVIVELRELNEPVAKPYSLPTEAEVSAAEKRLNIKFHEDYRQFLLEASDVVVGTLEPAMVAADCGYLNLVEIAEYAWDEMELPLTLLPICEDNGDYYSGHRTARPTINGTIWRSGSKKSGLTANERKSR
jgi:SMI1-KNR4 cell-wall